MQDKIKDVIMLLPTKNRHIYLNRVNDFYKSTDLKLVILDSTPNKYQKDLSNEIDYLHLPNHNVVDKLRIAIKKYKNYPFIVIGADDDFTLPRAIMECVQFLKCNDDYATAQGYFMTYRKKGEFLIRPQYQEMNSLNFSQKDIIERFVNYSKNSGTTYYSVHRSDIFKITINEMKKINIKESGLNIWESILGHMSIISGKHKILPTLYALRESWPEKSVGTIHPKLWDLRFNKKLIHNYNCILDILIKEILRNVDMNDYDAKNIVEKTFEEYFASTVIRKKMGLDKGHPLIGRIRNFLARLNGFVCRNIKFFEKLFSRDEYVVNSLVNSNKEFQKEIVNISKLYYKYPVI